MMKRVQQGFTLIELMIVVAIIGILAAVAIPAYSDYTARSQVTEAVSLTSALKTPIAEFFADKGRMPSDIASVGGTATGKYVYTVALESTAGFGGGTVAVVAQMKSTDVNRSIQDGYFVMSTEDGGNQWVCGTLSVSAGVATNANDIDEKYLPAACR
jgi:type IV pilus assembly protein PilA